eukprot:scaffold18750_cov113-Isochrysis_galbana.AAC.10
MTSDTNQSTDAPGQPGRASSGEKEKASPSTNVTRGSAIRAESSGERSTAITAQSCFRRAAVHEPGDAPRSTTVWPGVSAAPMQSSASRSLR